MNSQNWQTISFEQSRSIAGLLFNPSVNESLAQFNIVEHFARDVQELSRADLENLQTLSSFHLLRSLMSLKLNSLDPMSQKVQFKIVADRNHEKIDIFVSDWLEARA